MHVSKHRTRVQEDLTALNAAQEPLTLHRRIPPPKTTLGLRALAGPDPPGRSLRTISRPEGGGRRLATSKLAIKAPQPTRK